MSYAPFTLGRQCCVQKPLTLLRAAVVAERFASRRRSRKDRTVIRRDYMEGRQAHAISVTDDRATDYALDGWPARAYGPAKGGLSAMGNEVLSTEVLRHGAYICLTVPGEARARVAAAAVPALTTRLKLHNEFDAEDGHPPDAVAFLKRIDAAAGTIADDDILQADAVVHVASRAAGPVAEFCSEVTRLLAPAVKPHVLRGVVRP